MARRWRRPRRNRGEGGAGSVSLIQGVLYFFAAIATIAALVLIFTSPKLGGQQAKIERADEVPAGKERVLPSTNEVVYTNSKLNVEFIYPRDFFEDTHVILPQFDGSDAVRNTKDLTARILEQPEVETWFGGEPHTQTFVMDGQDTVIVSSKQGKIQTVVLGVILPSRAQFDEGTFPFILVVTTRDALGSILETFSF